MAAHDSILCTSSVTQPVAVSSKTMIRNSIRIRVRRDREITLLPTPIPRMKAINTTANDWRDEPNISASEREANSSNPMEIPPVAPTSKAAQRQASAGKSPG